MGFADVGYTGLCAWYEQIEQRGFAYARVAAEQCYFAIEQGAQGIDAVAGKRRHLIARITNVVVERHHHVLIVTLFVGEQVGLVKHQYHRYAVGLSRGEKAVDKRRGGLGMSHGDDQHRLVEVGSDDVALFGQVL